MSLYLLLYIDARDESGNQRGGNRKPRKASDMFGKFSKANES